MSQPFILVMGVSGAGKSALGAALASALGVRFIDADDYHPIENKMKMSRGEGLTDQDRLPWLKSLAQLLRESSAVIVLACSALKEQYRQLLQKESVRPMRILFLNPSLEILESRLRERRGHFFNPSLLASQRATLEPPRGTDLLELAGNDSIEVLVQRATDWLAMRALK